MVILGTEQSAGKSAPKRTRFAAPVALALALALGGGATVADASPTLCGLPLLPACPVTTTSPTPPPSPTPTPSPTPASPAPRVDADARYDGRDGARWYATVSVANNANRVTAFAFGFYTGSCSDSYHSSFAGTGKGSPSISSAGRVSYSGFERGPRFLTASGKLLTGREQISFSIRFSGDRLAGTFRDTFRSGHVRCSSGPVAFTAFRDGTAKAPLKTARIATGRYAGSTDQSGSVVLGVFLPLRWITSLQISFKLHCTGSESVTGEQRSNFDLVFLQGTSFNVSEHDAYAGPHGLYYRERYRVDGTFSGPKEIGGGRYSASGNWSMSLSIYRAGHRLGLCSTGPAGDRFPYLAGPRS